MLLALDSLSLRVKISVAGKMSLTDARDQGKEF